jgi:hypothetical protein
MNIIDIIKPPKPATSSDDIPTVKLGIIGTSTAGKSYLVTAINYLVLNSDIKLNNNLSLDVADGVSTARRLDELRASIEIMRTQALPGNDARKNFTFRLVHGIKPICTIAYDDNVGQVLTNVTDPRNNPLRNEFIKAIKTSDVIWLFVPMQVDQSGECSGIKRDDLILTKAYLVDALQSRSDNSPLALAIVLTKIDVLGDIESDSSKKKLTSIAQSIKEFFTATISSPMISVAALFPISALGFDNTKFIYSETDLRNPTTFTLSGNTIRPYNVDKLLVWSLSCFMYQNTNVQIDGSIKQAILQNIQEKDGLIYVLKAGS